MKPDNSSRSENLVSFLNNAASDGSIVSTLPVSVTSIPIIQNGGVILIDFMDGEPAVQYKANHIWSEGKGDNFEWHGVAIGEKEGWARLTQNEGEVFGEIVYGQRDFRLYTFGKSSVLIEIDKQFYGNKICTQEFSDEVSGDSIGDIQHLEKSSSGTNTIRVLTLYTVASEAHMNPSQRASMLINEANASLINSGVSLGEVRFEGAGVARLDNFIENSNNSAFEDYQRLRNDERDNPNGNIATLRNDNQADLVVLLGDGNYTEIGATSLGPNAPLRGGYLVVDVNFPPSRLTFAHELGHTLGCRHDDSMLEGVGVERYAKGFRFFTGGTERWTIMASNPVNNTRIPHFSSPVVNFQGVTTGTTLDNDNVRQIKAGASSVACYRDYIEPVEVIIDGFSMLPEGSSSTWCPITFNCNDNLSFVWEYSENGFSFSHLSNNTCVTMTAPDVTHFFLRMTANCGNGESDVDILRVEVEASGGGGPEKSFSNQISQSANTPAETFEVFPNPFNDVLTLKLFDLPDGEYVETISLTNMKGQIFDVEASPNDIRFLLSNVSLNTNSIPFGAYFVLVKTNRGKILRKKIVKTS